MGKAGKVVSFYPNVLSKNVGPKGVLEGALVVYGSELDCLCGACSGYMPGIDHH